MSPVAASTTRSPTGGCSIFIPICHGCNCIVGVLEIVNMKVPIGDHPMAPQPEHGLLDVLEKIGHAIGPIVHGARQEMLFSDGLDNFTRAITPPPRKYTPPQKPICIRPLVPPNVALRLVCCHMILHLCHFHVFIILPPEASKNITKHTFTTNLFLNLR